MVTLPAAIWVARTRLIYCPPIDSSDPSDSKSDDNSEDDGPEEMVVVGVVAR